MVRLWPAEERSPPSGHIGRLTPGKGDFFKSEDYIGGSSAFWGFYFGVRSVVHAGVSLISQGKETPPPQHECGLFVAGPPPLKDDRERIIVEGCSLSSFSPAATSARL